MSIEAMKQALEALYKNEDFLLDYHKCEPNNEREIDLYSECHAKNKSAITSLRQAIAEAQKQEPVAWITQGGKGWLRWHKAYDDNTGNVPLYTSQPQRQPLTDEQISKLAVCGVFHGDALAVTRAIEAAHGIKGAA